MSIRKEKRLMQPFHFCSTLTKFDENMLAVEVLLFSSKTIEESRLYYILKKGCFHSSRGCDLQIFFLEANSQTPSVLLSHLHVFFHAYSLSPVFPPSNC